MNKLTLFLVSMLWVLLALGATIFAVQWSMPLFFGLAAAVPIGIFLLSRPKLVYMLTFSTIFSGLVLPGMPATMSIHHLLALLLILMGILGSALKKQTEPAPFYYAVLIAILLNLGVIIMVRGAGFRVLGDSNWGGARYIDIFLSIGLMMFARSVTLTMKEWKIFFVMFLIFSLLPFFAEALFLSTGGRVYQQYYFIRMNTATVGAFFQEAAGETLVRFQSGNRVGVLLGFVACLLYYLNPKRFVIPAVLLISGLLLVGVSGHRSGLLDLVLLAWVTGFLICRSFRNLYLQVTIFAGIGALVLLYAVGPHLPVAFQRMFTIIPGIDWSYEAIMDADATWQWRLNLWREGLNEMRMRPNFFIIGKGYTYSGAEYEALLIGTRGEYSYWFAVIMSVYHQGILTLLIGMGVPGLILFTVFFGASITRHLRFANGQWKNASLQKAHTIVLAFYIILVLKFYTVYGDLFVSLPTLAFWLVILEGLINSHKQNMKKSIISVESSSPLLKTTISTVNIKTPGLQNSFL